jgi:hypothetical protein
MDHIILLLNMLEIRRRHTWKVQSYMADNLHGDVNSSNCMNCSHGAYIECPLELACLLHVKAIRHDCTQPGYTDLFYRPIFKRQLPSLIN